MSLPLDCFNWHFLDFGQRPVTCKIHQQDANMQSAIVMSSIPQICLCNPNYILYRARFIGRTYYTHTPQVPRRSIVLHSHSRGAQTIHGATLTRHNYPNDPSCCTNSPQLPSRSIMLHSLAIATQTIHCIVFPRHKSPIDPSCCHRPPIKSSCCTRLPKTPSQSIMLHTRPLRYLVRGSGKGKAREREAKPPAPKTNIAPLPMQCGTPRIVLTGGSQESRRGQQ